MFYFFDLPSLCTNISRKRVTFPLRRGFFNSSPNLFPIMTTKISFLLCGLLVWGQLAFGQFDNSTGTSTTSSNLGIGSSASSSQKLKIISSGNPVLGTSIDGLRAEAYLEDSYAIRAYGSGPSHSKGHGLYAQSDYGYAGFFKATAGGYGIYAWSDDGQAGRFKSANGYAGYFEGRAHVTQNLSLAQDLLGTRSSGAFTIFANSSAANGAYLHLHGASSSSPGEISFVAGAGNHSQGGRIRFSSYNPSTSSWREAMRIDGSGKVGIGTTNFSIAGCRLYVQDGIATGKVNVNQTLADYVFAPGYDYPSLGETETYIQEHRHLPGVMSQAEVDAAGGTDLGLLTVQLQQKLEELYLHSIEQEKRIQALEAELKSK